jgi:hypothetical protein
MSTGLTYVFIQDSNTANPPAASANFVFQSYEEAYNYGDWWGRVNQNFFNTGVYVFVTIYTTGPNPNGYWDCFQVPPVWYSFD